MKRAEQRERTRGLILASARKLFLERGYERTTMRDIASAATRTTGSIFALYPDKASVFEAAMGRPAPDTPELLTRIRDARFTDGEDAFSWAYDLQREAEQLLNDLCGLGE